MRDKMTTNPHLKLRTRLLEAACIWIVTPLPGFADSAQHPLLHEIFQDHAVLQRDQPIRVWGESAAGDRISVSIEGGKAEARADAAGHWQAALPAGGPYALGVHTQSGASQSISDVLIGDVFLCSGQSNMELPVANTLNH